MLKFRLYGDAKSMFKRDKSSPLISQKRREYYNSPEFYAKHPDLMPRNIYLATGRFISKEKMERKFNALFHLSIKDKCVLLFNRIKHLVTGFK